MREQDRKQAREQAWGPAQEQLARVDGQLVQAEEQLVQAEEQLVQAGCLPHRSESFGLVL